MKEDTFAFIGAGNMGGALIQAVCCSADPKNVTIYDKAKEKTEALALKTGCKIAESVADTVKSAKFLFLCVKPNVLADTLISILPVLKDETEKGSEKVVVSIAAGVAISAVSAVMEESGITLPVIRLMPNTPVAVGKGLILVSPSKNTEEEDVTALCKALSAGGETAVVEESLIDPATPVFSCSPAYVYMFIEALADGGVMSGVPRDMAQKFAAQAVLGAAAMVLESGRHPGELKDAVCSPGGSTIVGVEELEKRGFRAAASSAIYEAYKKTVALGK